MKELFSSCIFRGSLYFSNFFFFIYLRRFQVIVFINVCNNMNTIYDYKKITFGINVIIKRNGNLLINSGRNVELSVLLIYR